MFIGFVTLEDTLYGLVRTMTTAGVPTDSAAAPTYRVYAGGSLITTGVAALLDSGMVTGATNTSPIVITDVAHGLNTGARITVASVGGNTAANGDFTVTRVDADTFSLDGSTGNGAYTSGGTWHVSGLYGFSIACTAANGFAAGTNYQIVWSYTVSSALAQTQSFMVG